MQGGGSHLFNEIIAVMPLQNLDCYIRRQYVCIPCATRERASGIPVRIYERRPRHQIWFHVCIPEVGKMPPTAKLCDYDGWTWHFPIVYIRHGSCAAVVA